MPLVQAILDHTDIDVCGIEQRLAVRPPVAQRREVAVRRALGDCACERQPVGMYAGALEQDDGIAVLDVRANQPAFRPDHADRGAGQDDCGGLDNPAQCRRLSAAPRAARKLARLPPAVDKISSAAFVLEPVGRPDAEMHGHGQRQRAKRDHVVHDHRNGVLRDVIVVGTRRHQAIHRIGDEVLRAEPLLDVREIALGRLDEIRALAAAHLDFGDAETSNHVGRRSAGELRPALERIERAIVDARTRVGHAFHG